VIADLVGPAFEASLAGGVDVLKLNSEELVAGGWARDDDACSLVDAMHELRRRGARAVVASRASAPALVLRDDRVLELEGVALAPADPAGAGDSMVAALAVALGRRPSRSPGRLWPRAPRDAHDRAAGSEHDLRSSSTVACTPAVRDDLLAALADARR